MPDERDPRVVRAACARTLGTFDPHDRSARSRLLALAERVPTNATIDRYGGGALAERLEARVAQLLGKEAAVWLPSGTMAQQIALRIHADRRGLTTVAFHPHCHLDVHEERGYQALHGLQGLLVGSRDRLLSKADVEAVREPIAALLLELPQRDLGGQLPAWDDLTATCETARARGAALHLDGARLWQCPPFYARPLEEIARLFDTVYVSFYKDLGAPAGCALAGTRDVVDEARVWQVRHGGRLFTAYPLLLEAEYGLDVFLPRMAAYVDRAREVGSLLASLDGVSVVPDPPQAAMLHVLVRRPLGALQAATLDIAEESHVWIADTWRPSGDPDVQRAEMSFGEASFALPLEEARRLWLELLTRSAAAV
jgi:threonine aldolase